MQALGEFSLALDGALGDEGPAIHDSLDRMERSLSEWDARIRAYEAAMAADLGVEREPTHRARLHLALAGVYLDRNRTPDGLHELSTAATLDPANGEVHLLTALVLSQRQSDPTAAARAFGTAWSLAPADPVRAYLFARQLLALGRTDEAGEPLQAVLDSHGAAAAPFSGSAPFIRLDLVPESSGVEPFFPPARYADGFDAIRRGEYGDAIVRFREEASRDTLSAGWRARREAVQPAASALRDGDLRTAIDYLGRAVRAAPDDPELHRLLGRALALERQFDDAGRSFGEAIRLEPGDERSRLGLGELLMEQGRLRDAERVLSELLDVLPHSGRARHLLAQVYEREKRYTDAARTLEEAVAARPFIGLNGVFETIGALRAAQQDVEGAAAAYSSRVEVHPNDAGAHYDLGDTYATVDRDRDALAEFVVALLIDPAFVRAHVAMSQLLLAREQYEGAVAAARRALSLEPQHIEAQYALATGLIRMGRAEEGRQALEAFRELQQEEAAAKARQFEIGALTREAELSEARQDHATAVELLRKAAALAPGSADARLALGRALSRAGRHLEAVEHFSSAVLLDAGYEVFRDLAEAYAAAGRVDQSRKAMAIFEQMKRDALRRTLAR